jgi:hypothetical protein
MNLRLPRLVIIVLTCLAALNTMLSGQTRPSEIAARLDRIPGVAQRQFAVLGDRMRVSGKELTIYTGDVVDAAGNRSPAQVIYQTPGLVRLSGFKPGQAVVSFDGERALGVISNDDDLLLETFVMDMPEGMLASIQGSAAVRLLGSGFGPDPRKMRNYAGARYDILDVTSAVRSRSDKVTRSRLYYFDSSTGLLQSTRYYDRSRSSPVKLETHFSEWRNIDGSTYPSRIDRYERGQRVFSFVANTITAAPRLEPERFR